MKPIYTPAKNYITMFSFLLFSLSTNAETFTPIVFPGTLVNNQLQILKYTEGSAEYLDVSDIYIQDPSNLPYFNGSIDYKYGLIKYGYAKLKNSESALPKLIDAQNSAREKKLNMWAKDSPKTPSTINYPTWDSLKDILNKTISIWGGIGTLIASLSAFNYWKRKKKIRLLFFGLPSTGKTWISTRLIHPEIKKIELEKLNERTRTVTEKLNPRIQIWGRYELMHENVDIPGAAPGEQLSHMLRKDFGKRQIWIITLSTTQNRQINFTSNESEKFDDTFLEQQLGYLNLPIAAIETKNINKPELVVLLLTKMDIFSTTEDTPTSVASSIDMKLRRHKLALENACKGNKIPFCYIKCSATEGWGISSISREIHDNLFPKAV